VRRESQSLGSSGFSKQQALVHKWVKIVTERGEIKPFELQNMLRITVGQYNQLKRYVMDFSAGIIAYDSGIWISLIPPETEKIEKEIEQ